MTSMFGALREHATYWAAQVLVQVQQHPPAGNRAVWIAREAGKLVGSPRSVGKPQDLGVEDLAAVQFCEAVARHWSEAENPGITGGASGSQVLRKYPGLWGRLMQQWPMGRYGAELAGDVGELVPGARVLELGAGVGNTTRLLDHAHAEDYFATDLYPSISERAGLPNVRWLDFDQPMPAWVRREPFDLVLATNAVHCAAVPERTLSELYGALGPGGVVALAEGAPGTAQRPWPLTWAFGAMDGWWDRGGFRDPEFWRRALEGSGFVNISGRHLFEDDGSLVGTVWTARRPA